MIKLKDILFEKKLRVFDFDDTLAKTSAMIYVTGKDGNENTLTPGEYAVYKPKKDDVFDYRDFNAVTEPEVIKNMKHLFDKIKAAKGERRITVLTARAMFKPIKTYLKQAGFGNNVFVVALAGAEPQKKADWIRGQIKKGYNNIAFWDDSAKNVKAVSDLKKDYPDIKLKSKLVRY